MALIKNKKKYRLRISEEENEIIKDYRAIKENCDLLGIDNKDVKHGWLKSDKASIHFHNPNFKTVEQQDFNILKDKILNEVYKKSPVYKPIKHDKKSNANLLVIDPADIHVGKLCRAFETGEEYNQQIAVQRVKEGVNGILSKASGFNIDEICLIIGNDILHTDSPKRTTTSGTPQDTDGMWYDNFLTAKRLYIDLIEQLMQVANVKVIYNPSNHDYTHGFFLAQLIETHFRQSENISFNVDLSHRKAFKYYNNLIGTTHGDGAREANLPLLLAQEFSMEWAQTKHRYIYTHHVHHKTSKDYIGVTIESLRSPSAADSWHHRNGYQHSPKAIEGFIHDKENGQIARLTHLF
jgi:hypothetical protein